MDLAISRLARRQHRYSFYADRRRDQRLMRAGYRVVRFTWWQVRHAPREILETLRALLA